MKLYRFTCLSLLLTTLSAPGLSRPGEPASGPCICGKSKAPTGVHLVVGIPGKPGFPKLEGGRILVAPKHWESQLTFVVEVMNESDKPQQTFGSGIGGELTIFRHEGKREVAVTTLRVPPREDGAKRIVAPHSPFSLTLFPWPGAANAPPGKYVARGQGAERTFELPWTNR